MTAPSFAAEPSDYTRLLPESGGSVIDLAAIKNLLAVRRDEIVARNARADSGMEAAGKWAAEIDCLVAAAAARAAAKSDRRHRGFAVVALGGYGRGELNPSSDIDLMVLYDRAGTAVVETFAAELFRPLWDTGLDVGHACRDLRACARAMTEDIKSATAILECRLVWGDLALFERLRGDVIEAHFVRHARDFVDRKILECLARHARQGNTAFRMRPDIKEAPGGLRDLHTISWTERALDSGGIMNRLDYRQLVSRTDRHTLARTYDLLLRIRTEMHALCKRRQDVLDYELQPKLAARLGYADGSALCAAELFMRDYYRHASGVHRILKLLFALYAENRSWARRGWRVLQRRRVTDDFVQIAGQLYLARKDTFEGPQAGRLMMAAFVHCQHRRLAPGQEIIKRVHDNLHRVDDALRADEQAAAGFLEILNGERHVGPVLRAMHEAGFLGKYIPAFGELTCLVNYDVYHDFTVDEHTLRAITALDELPDGPEAPARLRKDIFQGLARPWLLRLALLLHDLGKSKSGGDHAERGAVMIPQIAARLHLSEADTRLLADQIRHHLVLSTVSRQRDYRETSLLEATARKIGGLEQLNLLFLLTWCDAVSVGRGSWPHWHDELMYDLYLRLREVYQSKGKAESREPIEQVLLRQAGDPREADRIRRHLELVPARYRTEVAPHEARRDIELIHRLEETDVVTKFVVDKTFVDFWVASGNQTGRFAQIAGALTGHHLNILSARAYTRADGVIIDHFVLARPAGGDDDGLWTRVSRDIAAIVRGELRPDRLLARAQRRVPSAESVRLEIEPRIVVDNRSSEAYTIIDVICGDRIGLLYALATKLADDGLDIHFAKISTVGGMATDVFYVTDAASGRRLEDDARIESVRRRLVATCRDAQQARR